MEQIDEKVLAYLKGIKKGARAILKTRTCVRTTKVVLGLCNLDKAPVKVHERTVLLGLKYLDVKNEDRAAAGLEPLNATEIRDSYIRDWEVPGIIGVSNGQMYLRYYPDPACKEETKEYYTQEGEPLSGVQVFNLKKYSRREGPKPLCFNVKLQNIIRLEIIDKDGDVDFTVIDTETPDLDEDGNEVETEESKAARAEFLRELEKEENALNSLENEEA